ncbi:hypothetical protein B0H12DRAFT_1067357 [Mycena haematopus]|nr:hypothetical protein B0H12DRAFT_1067357 [Mycena haematopus]
MTLVCSVSYCHTHGSAGYPFLIVQLRYPNFTDLPVLMKLEGADSPEETLLTLGGVHQGMRGLVGTWRYYVCNTVEFSKRGSIIDDKWVPPPKVVDFLALAELANESDCTRTGYPATLFLTLKTLFHGVESSSAKRRLRKAATLGSLDVANDVKSNVIDAFPARRRRMQEQIDFRRLIVYVRLGISVRIYELTQNRASIQKPAESLVPDNASELALEAALARVARLEVTIARLTFALESTVARLTTTLAAGNSPA